MFLRYISRFFYAVYLVCGFLNSNTRLVGEGRVLDIGGAVHSDVDSDVLIHIFLWVPITYYHAGQIRELMCG